jgi:fructose-1,6-bisphosphatase/inositol monophosphatase family enzyme
VSGLPDIVKVATLIEDVAASEIMPRFGRTVARTKTGPHDLVTEADEAAERALEARLPALAPGIVVGEEAVAANPGLLDAATRPEPYWVVDPVDGTANFAVGLPLFGVMVAYVLAGEAVAAWIHDPVRGITATAERGGGAWLGQRRLAVAKPDSLAHMAGTAGVRYGARDIAERVGRRADRVASYLILRCAAQEYLALLQGQTHFCLYHRTYPWDHAPGCLLATEAGGVARRLDGTAYRAGDGIWSAPLLISASDESWGWVKAALIDP